MAPWIEAIRKALPITTSRPYVSITIGPAVPPKLP